MKILVQVITEEKSNKTMTGEGHQEKMSPQQEISFSLIPQESPRAQINNTQCWQNTNTFTFGESHSKYWWTTWEQFSKFVKVNII